jgi:hypothetical protein
MLLGQDLESKYLKRTMHEARQLSIFPFADIKWDGEQPDFVSELTTLEGPHTYTEILDILSTPEWSAPMEEE